MSELVKSVLSGSKNVSAILEKIYDDLARPGVKNVGRAIGTVLDLFNTILLPVDFINSKASIIFRNNLEKYKASLESIEYDEVTEVPLEIGVPILEKLRYVSNEDISNFFVSLLSQASYKKTNNLAHPSFISIVTSLSPGEARIIQCLHDEFNPQIPMMTTYLHNEELKQSVEVIKYQTPVPYETDITFRGSMPLYWTNIISYGIIDCYKDTKLGLEKWYISLLKLCKEEAVASQIRESDGFSFAFVAGYLEVTDFGSTFMEACCKKELKSPEGKGREPIGSDTIDIFGHRM